MGVGTFKSHVLGKKGLLEDVNKRIIIGPNLVMHGILSLTMGCDSNKMAEFNKRGIIKGKGWKCVRGDQHTTNYNDSYLK